MLNGATDEVSKWTKQKQAGALHAATDKAQRSAMRKQRREEAARKKLRRQAMFDVELTYGFDFGPVDPTKTASESLFSKIVRSAVKHFSDHGQLPISCFKLNMTLNAVLSLLFQALRMDLPTDIILENFDLPHKKNDGTDLLSNASLTIARGRRYGLIGRNGCGKSTFFDALVQRAIEGVPSDCLIMSTKQHVKGDERTPLQWLLQAAPQQAAISNQLRELRHEHGLETLKHQQHLEMAELDKQAATAGTDGEDGSDDDEDPNGGGGGGSGPVRKSAEARAAAAAEEAAKILANINDLGTQMRALEEELEVLQSMQADEEVCGTLHSIPPQYTRFKRFVSNY